MLYGPDIPLNSGQSTPTVQNAVTANSGDITNLQNALAQEITDRGNADATLQTNINAALATIPGEVASQIAADATIAGLVAADAQNVKLTGAQTISGVKQVPLQTTGQYSAQIASSQKVKNELDNYSPMVRTTGNQTIAGLKTNVEAIVKKDTAVPAYTPPVSYVSKLDVVRITGSDDGVIVGLGYEKSTSNVSRAILTIYANKNTGTGNQTRCQLHFIVNEVDGTFKMTPAHVDKNGTRTFGTEQTLMSWTP